MRHGEVAAYCPDTGDIIWPDFLQSVANEQAGRRPALVLSPLTFNQLTRRCIACPITRRNRDWSFNVAIRNNDQISGVVQTNKFCSATRGHRGTVLITKDTPKRRA